MRHAPFGRFSISKIADMEDVAFPPQAICPDATEAAVRAAAPRLGPKLANPTTLQLMMSFNCYIVRTGRHTILVDSCIGNDKDRPARPTWHHRQGAFLDTLKSLGVAPESVDFVLCTHLHADHVGWNTRLVNGKWVPTFPKAQYLMAETEYRHWRAQHDSHPPEPILFGSFADSVLPVVDSGQAVMVPMNHEVLPGLHLEGAPGHTPGTVVIHVEDGSAHAIMVGDLMHHPIQIMHPEWSTNFCTDPAASRRTRIDFVRRHADTGTRILTGHFPAPTCGQIRRDGSGHIFVFDAVE